MLFVALGSETLVPMELHFAILPDSEEEAGGIKGHTIGLEVRLELCQPLLEILGIELQVGLLTLEHGDRDKRSEEGGALRCRSP